MIRNRVNLSKRVVESLPIPESDRCEYRDTQNRFLRMVVSSKGRLSWRYIRKVRGRTMKITLGTYPETTPRMARKECDRLSSEFDAGRDPGHEKRLRGQVTTWRQLFAWYLDVHAKPYKKTWRYDEDMSRRYCASWAQRTVDTFSPDMLARWHGSVGKTAGKHQADRVLAMVKCVFAKAVESGVLQIQNPAASVKKFFRSPQQFGRDRHLGGEEIGRLLHVLAKYPDRDWADFFSIALFTGARRGNIQKMRWQDMDRGQPDAPLWKIPGEFSKNGEPIRLPIEEPVASILNRRYESRTSDTWVFPAKQKGSQTPHISEPKKAWTKICEMAELKDLRIHDLRRTLGSWQARTGASLQVIGASLGHRSTRSTEIYARLDSEPVRTSISTAIRAMLTESKFGDQAAIPEASNAAVDTTLAKTKKNARCRRRDPAVQLANLAAKIRDGEATAQDRKRLRELAAKL